MRPTQSGNRTCSYGTIKNVRPTIIRATTEQKTERNPGDNRLTQEECCEYLNRLINVLLLRQE
jgi:hypothetical protein